MQGIITALCIVIIMIVLTVIKARTLKIDIICCKKSELEKLFKELPDDYTVQILLRNYDEHRKTHRP